MEQQQKEQSSSVPTTSNNNTTVEEQQQQDTTQTTTIPVVNNNEENVEETTTTKPLTEEELKEAIRKQIEYYFSNLSTNHYLVSQMSHDLYVPLQTIANFKMIKALTNGDLNLIINAIKSSTVIQLDEEEKRMKPININLPNKRTTVIIRNIPNTVEKEKILSLFETNNLPSNVYAEIGDTWFCSFSEEEQAMNALNHLRNNCSWNDKPIQARIKSENILKSVNNNVSNTSTTNISGGNVTGSMNNHTNNNNGNHNYQNNNQQGGYQKRYNNYRNNNNRYVKNNTSPNTNDNNNQQQQHRRRTNRSNSGANNNTTNVTSSSSSPSTTNTTTTTTNNQQQVNVGNNNNRKSHHGHSHYNKHYQHHNQHYRKEQINLSSVKSFPPLPKLNETTESGGMVGYPITHKFLRYSKQTVIKVYMKQQKEGEHANFPTDLITLNSAKCLAILNEPKSELELRKPQMEKSKIANLTIAPEGGNATTTGVSGNDEGTATSSLSIQTTNVGTGTTTVGSKKPLNLIIPPKSPTEFSKSFAEAAITAKDIKTPDLPSSSGFFAKQRKRRTGSINKNDSHHGTVGSSSGHHHHHHSKGNNENKRDNTSSTTRGKKHHSGGLKKSTTGVHYHKQERNNENAISLSNVDMLKTNNENDKEQQQENNEINNEEQKQSWVSVVASTKK